MFDCKGVCRVGVEPTIIFDGHNDVLCRLWNDGGLEAAPTFLTGRKGALDVKKATSGGFGGGFFAIYVPSAMDREARLALMQNATYDLPLPEPIEREQGLAVAMSQAAILRRLEALGALKICRSSADIRTCFETGIIAAIMHIEGAEAIDPDLAALEVFYQSGLRSIGPVWSRPTIFGHGVPFRFPSDGDIGPGLTEHGVRLVRRCNELQILIDLSHLNEKGFWDVAEHSSAPLVATHSNAHALCASSRNLTDRQLRAIAETQGMVGVNFSVSFLREDGQKNDATSLDAILRHLDHLMQFVGEDCVGFGSDYDGAMVPKEIENASLLPRLINALEKHGYSKQLISKLCHGNWLRVLKNTWGA